MSEEKRVKELKIKLYHAKQRLIEKYQDSIKKQIAINFKRRNCYFCKNYIDQICFIDKFIINKLNTTCEDIERID